MANLLNKNFRLNGINQDTQFVKQRSFLVDSAEHPEILIGNENHFLATFSKGEAFFGLKMVVLDVESSIAGDAAAKVEFALHFEGENITHPIEPAFEAISKSRIGCVYDVLCDGIQGYKKGKNLSIVMKTDKSGLTKLKVIIFVDTIPVDEFLTLG